MRQNNYASARETLWAANPAQRNWEWGYLLNRCYLDLYSLDDCVAAAYNPDGTRIATLSQDKPIEIWNAEDGRKITEFGDSSKRVFVHEYSPDGTRLAGAGQDNAIRVWDAQSGAVLAELFGHTKNISTIHFDRTGTRIVSAAADKTVRVWDAASGRTLHTLDVPDATPISAFFSANADSVLYTAEGAAQNGTSPLYECRVSVWEPAASRNVFTVQGGHPALSPDGSLLAVADGTDMALIGMADGQTRGRLRGHTGHIRDIRFSADGAVVVSGASDGTARMYQTASAALVSVMEHGRAIDYVRLGGDGKRLLTASNEGTLKIWDAATGRLTNTLNGHTSIRLFTADFSPDGRRIATGSLDQSVKVWDAGQSPGQRAIVLYDRPIKAMTVSSGGEYAAVLLPNRTMEIRRVADGAVVAAMASYSFRGGLDAAFRPDGKRIAAVLDEFTPMVWDIGSQQVVCKFTGHQGPVMCLAFSPDGKRVVSGSWDDTVRVWDAETGAEIVSLADHADTIRDVAYGDDGKVLATGSEDGTAIVWDAVDGHRLRTFDTQGGSVLAVCFSHDGRLLATAGERQPARIWETGTGREVHTLTGLAGDVDGIAFLAGDARLAASSRGGAVALWSVQTGSELISIEDQMRIGENAYLTSSAGLLAASIGSGSLVELAPLAWAPGAFAHVQSMPERDRVAYLRGASAAPPPGQSALRIAVVTTPERAQNAMARLAGLVATADTSGGAIGVDGAVYDALAPLCVLRGDLLASINDVAAASPAFGETVRAAQSASAGITLGITRNGAPAQLQVRLMEVTVQPIERDIDLKTVREYFEMQKRIANVWRRPSLEFDRARASDLGDPPGDGDSVRGIWVAESPQVPVKRHLMAFGLAAEDRVLALDGEKIANYAVLQQLGDNVIGGGEAEGGQRPIHLDVERGMFRRLQLTLVPK